MIEFFLLIINYIYKMHNWFLSLNDAYEYNFTDKELHFIVIGTIGMIMLFMVYPFFKWLANHNKIMIITFIYVFTLIIVLTFSIEIAQKVSNTGSMEFGDIIFGVVGFLVMYFVFLLIRLVVHFVISFIKKRLYH